MKAIILFILFIILTIPTVFGQIKIGDNPQNIDPASVLELESTSKVLVITRVSTLEMEAITPQRGGIVYNIDTECINYYDGTQWVNLCDAVNFTITNDPIINNRATIEITQTASGYNLEIAKNGILGDNIVDGGIGPDDIQDNSITQEKLAAESVGSSEIRQNAVGSDEIRDGSIAPSDIANFIPGQVLVTDENGIVQWGDAGDLMGAVVDEITITGSGTSANPLEITEGIQLNISNNSVLIADHIVEDNDTDDTNELIDLTFDELTKKLTISQSATPDRASVDLSILNNSGTDDQTITQFNLNPTTKVLTLTLENGGTRTVPLQSLSETNTDNQTLSITNDFLEISGGNSIELTDYINTDSQQLAREGNLLSISGIGGNTITLPTFTEQFDGTSIIGDGTATDRFRVGAIGSIQITNGSVRTEDITPASPAPTNTQVLTTSNAGVVGWIDLPTNTPASTELADGTSIIGIGTATDRFRVGAIGSGQITNGSVGTVDITPAGPAPANTQVLTTSTTGVVDWIDLPSGSTDPISLNNRNIFIGDTNNEAAQTLISKDATMNNLGELTINDAVVTPIKIEPSNVNGQYLRTNAAGNVVWDNLPTGTAGTVTSDETTITGDGLATALQVPLGGITSAQIFDGTISTIDLALGAVETVNILDGTILEIDIADNNVTPAKIEASATTGQILTTDAGGDVIWENLTNSANSGSILFSDGTGGIAENIAQLNWDGSSLGIGVAAPTAQLQVANQIRAGSFSGPATGGSANLPTYRFNSTTKNDGMFQPNEDEIAFSTGGVEAIRIDDSQNVGIGPNFNVNSIDARLHVEGDIRADNIYSNGVLIPDYVFQKYFTGYSNLNPIYNFGNLRSIETFIKKNHHLPGIKSADEIKKAGKWSLNEASRINLEKIEELFLHTIEQEKKIKELESSNKNMAGEVEALKAQIEVIKTMLLEKSNK